MTLHFITPEYPPMLGGVADHTRQLAIELTSKGAKVHVWGPALIGAQQGSAIVVHPSLGRFRPSDLRRTAAGLDTFPSPRRLIVQWVPHGYGYRAMNVWFCFWLWRRAIGGDSIDLIVHEPFVTFSGSLGQHALAVVQRAMTLMILSAARRIWVTTRAWAPLLEPFLAGARTPVHWLPVPSNLRDADVVDVDAVRTRYAPGKEPLIGHFGTHGVLVTTLLESAIVGLINAHPSARFLLIGSGSDAFRSGFVERHPQLAHRVVATGVLGAETLPSHIAACDVLVQPYPEGVTSRRTTVMAGLFAGVPIVTTHGPLTEDFWHEDGPLRLAPVDDTQDLVQHVLQLIADPAARARQARAGRSFYDRSFDVRRAAVALVS